MGSVRSLSQLDMERATEEGRALTEAQLQCRIALSPHAPMPVKLHWHPGRGGRLSVIVLERGKTIVQPLDRAQVWFGPFAAYAEYEQCTDERRRDALRSFITTETARFLNRYDYPRGARGLPADMRPTGPHRAPDVTITILEADGSEHEPIRLHELYEIGEFDPLRDELKPPESAESVEERYQRILEERDAKYAAMQENFREMAGMVKGLAVAVQGSKAS